MDWNNNGKLEPAELAATFTLFQVGPEITRYKFLFHCLDLDESKSVSFASNTLDLNAFSQIPALYKLYDIYTFYIG